jgi:hypothetical protein
VYFGELIEVGEGDGDEAADVVRGQRLGGSTAAIEYGRNGYDGRSDLRDMAKQRKQGRSASPRRCSRLDDVDVVVVTADVDDDARPLPSVLLCASPPTEMMHGGSKARSL